MKRSLKRIVQIFTPKRDRAFVYEYKAYYEYNALTDKVVIFGFGATATITGCIFFYMVSHPLEMSRLFSSIGF